jgi:proteasome lid subunit RPN8/RPN11
MSLPPDGIDVSQIELDDLAQKAFPSRRPFRISISEEAHQAVWMHARKTLLDGDPIKEVGGILVGNIYKDTEGPFLEVKAAIVAEHTRNEGTEVAFTPETWDHINQAKDRLYPGDKIVGWYHTHPRFGIFLSERDKFIQQHSFAYPWATAFVIDPVQNAEGFFFWSNGELQEVPEYWVGHKHREQSSSRETLPASSEPSNSHSVARAGVSRLTLSLVALMGVVGLLLATGLIDLRGAEHSQIETFVVRAFESHKAELERALQMLRLLRKDTEQMEKQAKDVEAEMRRKIQNLESELHNLGNVIAPLQAQIEELQKVTQRQDLAKPKRADGKKPL